jgi:hypothetical protein
VVPAACWDVPGFKHSHDWCFELARDFATAPKKSPEHACMKAGIAEDNYDGCFEYLFSDCLANAVTGTCVPWLTAHPPGGSVPGATPPIQLPDIPITPGDTWGGETPAPPPATQPASGKESQSSPWPWVVGALAITVAGVAAWQALAVPATARGARNPSSARVLDLRSLSLGASPIFTAATKVEAIKFARKFGWPARSTMHAGNRFWTFWVVGQNIDSDTLRLLNQDGTWSDMPWPGYW